jgi:hypothetical protein
MTESTELAHGTVNSADHLSVELVEPPHMPAIVRIAWPPQPTVVDPANYPAIAATITKIIAESATALARWKAGRL